MEVRFNNKLIFTSHSQHYEILTFRKEIIVKNRTSILEFKGTGGMKFNGIGLSNVYFI